MKKKVKKVLKLIVISFISLLIVGSIGGLIYESTARKNALKAYPPPGEMISVGSHKLHLDCRGTAEEGAPTVILEAGLDPMGGSILWSGLIDSIAEFCRVCTYDKAGIAWSEIGPQPRVADKLVDELHLLLENSNEKGPYLLVAWSMGGPYARLFAKRYFDEMAGLILVDSSHPEQFERLPANKNFSVPPKFILKTVPLLRKIGIMRNVMKNELNFPQIAPEKQTALYKVSAGSISTVLSEFSNILESLEQAAEVTSLDDLPLTVLGAVDPPNPSQVGNISKELLIEGQKAWFEMQRELSELSTQGKLVPVSKSGHYIHFDQPGMVLNEIREMYERLKTDTISTNQ
ncbi:alpha/beta fold hydrolase [Roseivirga sp. E12]|uniref:alpha/beta fold hydrolase n=1 Tax=Roseivirga sp. E12 TaxID=2819237 RepID=UPI001ABC609B|nr:alpha/beta hydrolase [Roseivirga sp. E12]MBO3697014.1 alpha/beta hydrolase [Roseivirga sp. E12]